MAQAYKCELDGKLYEGDGVGHITVDISANCLLRIVPFGKDPRDGKSIVQGKVCPEQAAIIVNALQKVFNYTPPPPAPAVETKQ